MSTTPFPGMGAMIRIRRGAVGVQLRDAEKAVSRPRGMLSLRAVVVIITNSYALLGSVCL
jgi:hypothetical protein